MQYGFLQQWDCRHNLLIKLGSPSLMIMDKRKLWDVPSYKRHFACPETRKHQNLLHTFRAISRLSWWNEQVQGSPKKQVTFLHQHCYNPEDAVIEDGDVVLKVSSTFFSPAGHTALPCRSELPGHRRDQHSSHSRVEAGPMCCLTDCAGSHTKDDAILLAWPVSRSVLSTCPFCRPWAQECSSSCPSVLLPTLPSKTKWVL